MELFRGFEFLATWYVCVALVYLAFYCAISFFAFKTKPHRDTLFALIGIVVAASQEKTVSQGDMVQGYIFMFVACLFATAALMIESEGRIRAKKSRAISQPN